MLASKLLLEITVDRSTKLDELKARWHGSSPDLVYHSLLTQGDCAWLINEIDALRAENERLKQEQIDAGAYIGKMDAEHDAEMAPLLVENERLRAVLEKIANSGNVHSSWLVGDAREALGLPRNTW